MINQNQKLNIEIYWAYDSLWKFIDKQLSIKLKVELYFLIDEPIPAKLFFDYDFNHFILKKYL